MVVGILATIASVETVRMSERIRSGLSRAKAEGKHVGRPRAAYSVSPAQIARERAAGASWGTLASKYSLPRTSVRRLYQKGLTEKDGGARERRRPELAVPQSPDFGALPSQHPIDVNPQRSDDENDSDDEPPSRCRCRSDQRRG